LTRSLRSRVSVGAAFVITSAALSGFYTSYLERVEARLQRRLRELEEKIAWSREYFASGSQKLSFADLKLVLLQSTRVPEEVHATQLNQLANDILRGIVDRNSAATGEHPAEHVMQAWLGIAKRAGAGDALAFSELSQISSGLIEKWAHRNNQLVKELDGYKAQIERTRRKVTQFRFAAVALQILGLTIVLMKDLPRPANTPLQPTSGGASTR
jgi:hypothetical protein